ncbi:hypothetical protein [Streptomyces wuyuanensis]|uniref:hypothetical protein n=1 Tax=Streptomyces wuyuanensis TaxID=1196353 RepID=UPI0034368439
MIALTDYATELDELIQSITTDSIKEGAKASVNDETRLRIRHAFDRLSASGRVLTDID